MVLKSKKLVTTEPAIPLRIGDVARHSGIGIEALRFYERSGLLGRPGRTQSGYRIYDQGVLQRLDFIKRAQVLGFSLDEIKRIIADKQAGRSPCLEVREIVRHRLGELDERLKEMRRYRRELGAALTQWEETGELDGHVCGLIEGTEIEHSNPTPRGLSMSKRRK
ncbi:MAG TPA: MerR family DNA-binding protein [Pyrinomonadaceae bacterium]|nr:MerR family DNA-binding protein [Pyrinomonadaceae bacterium]